MIMTGKRRKFLLTFAFLAAVASGLYVATLLRFGQMIGP